MILNYYGLRPGKRLVSRFSWPSTFGHRKPLGRRKNSRCRDYSIAVLCLRSACWGASYNRWS